ncbi:hypothetical protein GJV03_18815 [Acinetobacter sp. RIT698]|uniref:surface-adhesin E family protein n=1 Tax=Acinetobacter sp. RIT698 TaxID=2666192 RepID=UPI0012ACEB27|nr:surface-adhesin E family protein [Acinetobacter sp. RIT698]MRT39214.1 hypothetical protein [Acinetobacter sp. RIT698]
MKSLLLIFCLLVSSFCFGVDWKYVSLGALDEYDKGIYVDSSQYNYDKKKNSIKAWFKTESYDGYEGFRNNITYTRSKNLYEFLCVENKMRLLTYEYYDSKGNIYASNQFDSREVEYNTVTPGTLGESLWKVACISKGKGFRYHKDQTVE